MRVCGICRSKLKPMVESALVCGEKFSDIARRTDFSPEQVSRHAKHMAKAPNDAVAIEQQLNTWLQRLDSLYSTANASGDLKVAVESLRSAVSILSSKQALYDRKAAQDAEATNDAGEVVRSPSLAWMDEQTAVAEAAIAGWKAQGICYACLRPLEPEPKPAAEADAGKPVQ